MNSFFKVGGVVLRALGEMNPCPVKETIVIAGSPRTGTTWLLELFR
jgi:hypothetical protein